MSDWLLFNDNKFDVWAVVYYLLKLLIVDVVEVKCVNPAIMSAWLLFNDNKFDVWVVV